LPSTSTARWGAVSFFALATAWNYLDRLTLSAAAPRVMAEFHLTNTDYGWLTSAFALPYAIAAPLVGWFLDRLGLETGIVCAVALWSLSAALCGWTRSFGQLVGARISLGVWESAGIPAAGKLNAIYLEPKDRAIGAAITQIGIGLAGVGAPLLVAWFTGWRSPFFVCAALGLGWIPLWMLVRRSVRPYREVAPQRERGGLAILRDRRLIALALANVLWMVGYTFWTNWTTLYLVQTFKLTTAQANGYAWVPPVASVAGGFAGGWLSRRVIAGGTAAMDARVFAIFVSAIGCLVSVLAPFCPTPLLALVPVSLSYFAIVAGSVNIYTIPLDIWGGEHAGTAIAALGFAYGLMQTVISPLIGFLVDHFGFAPVCWLVALPPFAGWLLLRTLSRDNREQSQEKVRHNV
jgi:MFS transporter, ACS family, hexuronate transporter